MKNFVVSYTGLITFLFIFCVSFCILYNWYEWAAYAALILFGICIIMVIVGTAHAYYESVKEEQKNKE